MRNLLLFAPLAIFGMLAGLFGAQLMAGRDDSLPSALIAKPVPDFELPTMQPEKASFASADLAQGDVSIVNIWASWCGPCRVEHPELMKLADSGEARMFSLNYKDDLEAAERFLAQLGDPFELTGVDDSGMTALRWGVTGVPETFVVDGAGRIVYKHVGPIQNSDLEKKILPAIAQAKAGD